jgi:hypothetical protein
MAISEGRETACRSTVWEKYLITLGKDNEQWPSQQQQTNMRKRLSEFVESTSKTENDPWNSMVSEGQSVSSSSGPQESQISTCQRIFCIHQGI